ncbi:MAG: T9SS type A sorting domain-containing protein [Ferruginibacter sp.]
MKRIFTLIVMVAAMYSSYAQPYSTGKRTVVFIDNSRTAREISTDIYYPANTAGNNVPVATGVTKFPVVVFGHGFLMGTSSYKWLADSLVKTGYIVALPATEDGIIPNHLDFGLDLAFLCGRVTSLNDSATSFLYQRVIKKAAVGGHSMGGGASILASATLSSSINAVFNFAAAETTPPATLAAYLNLKPTLIFSGSADCIAPDSIQEVMYNNMLPFVTCKTYVNITDGLHCQFANNNLLCVIGQFASGCGITALSTSTLMTKTMALLTPWLDYYLKGNCQRGQVFLANYNGMTGVVKRRSCFPLQACGPVPVKLTSFTGNIKNDKVYLYWNTATEDNVHHIEVERSNDGVTFVQLTKVLPKGNNGGGANYNAVDPYPFAGMNFYRLKTVDLDGSISYSDIIKLETAKKALAVTQLYPNPVSDQLHIQLQSEKRQSIQVFVYDITGHQLRIDQVKLNAGINETSLLFADLAKGVYIIKLINEQGSISGTYKIVKD